ncbi:MAG TPA: bifunctional hydroxymethylpyrimidine kinase/phosphomethylpyrimidine kinase [Rariglobus sp.]|jgi:hydroxymethylpyrimidine/phosphomethylpyrimidine kinase|nr:bifunctional hydroxymethylpyrimidine kinase/phosphomethylpyrimidine kinase [Rariglobus sp.]
MKSPPCVLTIAGSDSGAGAGLQADSRTIHALGGYALTAVTTVTAQNSRTVTAWLPVSPYLLSAQITTAAEDFPIRAIKTGLLPGTAAVRAVATALAALPDIPLVIDPVIGSTSGTRFLSDTGLRALKNDLLPHAALVTPNWPEAALLTGLPVTTFSEAETAARHLLETGCSAVLVKGGHAPGRTCRDILVTADGTVRRFEGPRIATRNTHGTGCVLSAAIATGLAHSQPLATAITRARAFLQHSLATHRKLTLGGGVGPAFPGLKQG